MARRSSKSTVLTVPALATTMHGPSASASSRSSAATFTASRPPGRTGTARSAVRPRPSTDSALETLECALPDSTRTRPSAPAPSSATSTPSRSPSHSRAIASPTVVDIVAPLTKVPWCASDSPNNSRSQPTVSRSRC